MSFYSPKQVAQAIGVSEASLKRWCDRGLIAYVKTPGGHRRIPRQEVLCFIRDHRHDLVAPEIIDLPRGTRKHGKRSLDADRIYDLLVRGDERALRSTVVGGYLGGEMLHPFWDKVVAPTFHRIGEAWVADEIDIYQERLACEICTRLLHDIMEILPEPAADAPLAMGAAMSADPYGLPTLMVEATLRELGWRSRSLGTNLPGRSLERAIRDKRPRLFWLSISAVDDDRCFIEGCRSVWEACTAVGTILVVGGRGLSEERRRAIDYTVFCDHLGDMVNFLEGI